MKVSSTTRLFSILKPLLIAGPWLNMARTETKRQSVENELQALKVKNAGHADEVKALNEKIETLQSSNRANLGIIESNNKRDQTITEELTKQHQRNIELTREITALQQAEQTVKGQLNSAKYREDSLQQQLELTRRNGEWLEAELKTKSDEALKYRREKGACIVELQRQNEDLRSQVETLQRTEKQLRERLDAMQAKADEALVKLQRQESTFAGTVDSYKQELADQRRLVEMSQQLSEKHQERVRELEAEKVRLQDNYENELRRVRLELEQDRQALSQMEERNRTLEGEVDELQVRMEQNQVLPSGSLPQTPRANGSAMGRHASPFATPGSVRSKSAITATQAIEQLYQVKGQLASEKRRSQQLSEELDGMIAALEAKAPEILDLQSESETLRLEIARMSELSQQSFEERDAARKAARMAEAALSTAQSESNILKTQLRDLGTQIQMLVFNIYALEKGTEQLTAGEKLRIQQLEKGEITEDALADMSDTHQFITQKLLVFKDIKSLQSKNEELMRIIRELADQLESEEALAAKHQAKEDHDMVEKLQQELGHMAEETSSIRNTMESYKLERDMFRRLLQQRGPVGDETSMIRIDGSQRLPLMSIEGAEQTEALNEALRKLQAEYDGFRDAQDGVRKDFRDQIDHLTTERNSLQTENVRLHGEVRLESERRELLHSNYVALQSENSELQKRSQILSETAARQDIRTQQVAEELIEAKGLLNSTRNENANLKAEKALWKGIQDRMAKDIEAHVEEKNRLNSLLTIQQSLENERNISEAETRRKTQSKVESLERELSDTQRKLSNEVEEGKSLQLRKEYEAREAQKRIDELMASLSQLREDHVSVKTTRDHLQSRVDELTVQLSNAEERVGRLQPRSTPRSDMLDGNQQLAELEAGIQDLNHEVADLKRDYDLAKATLENAKAQAEQYKQLSQENEEALEDLRMSQDQYRQEMEALVEERETKVKELGLRVEDLSAELSRSNTELSSLRDSQGEVARKYEDEKTILEEEVNRLKEESARHVEAARYHQQDLRAQADIASKAQQDYEQELVRHAEAAKLVTHLRTEQNELKSQAAYLRAEADSAKVALAQSESSWEERRMQLEQEMAELKMRREDVNAQNKLLHQQLEGLAAQVAALQQSRDGMAGGDEEEMSAAHVGDATEGLRELNSYLRREKEILEVQYDLKSQESRRLQQQLEYTQSSLDEARLKLDQERTQAAQSGRNSMTHKDLMEKLNELNLYRESSAALRSENNHLKDQVSEKTKRVEALESQVQPLESEIENLKTQKGFLEEEIKQVQEDRDRWQRRTEGILTKYGRVDPEEMENLQQTIANLENERNTLKEGEAPLRAQVSELESTLESERANWQNTRERLTEQFKDRSRKLTGEKNEAVQRANALQEQLHTANDELAGAQKRAEEAGQLKADFELQIEGFKQQVERLRQQAQAGQQVAGGVASSSAEAPGSSEVVAQLEEQLASMHMALEAVTAQKAGAEQQLEGLRGELQRAISERDETAQNLQAARSVKVPLSEAAPASASAPDEHFPPTGAEASGANGQGGAEIAAGMSEDEKQALESRVAAAETKAAEFEAKANEVEAKIQTTIKERSDRMKDILNNKLRDAKGKLEEEFSQKNEELKVRFEQDKAIWLAEHSGSGLSATTQAPKAQQTPATPGQAEEAVATTPSTPAAAHSGAARTELSSLDDAGIRQFLATNSTVKSIVAGNIRKRLEAENAKIKSDWEGKVASAREQAQLMESKKATLRVNMAENKLKLAQVKLGIVETAAAETPQRPVVEVWDLAKKAQVTPASAATGPATPTRPAMAKQSSSTGALQDPSKPTGSAAAGAAGVTTAPKVEQQQQQQQPGKQAVGTPQMRENKAQQPEGARKSEGATPGTPVRQAQQQQQQQQHGQPKQQQGQPQQPPARTGIPVARGGPGGGAGRGRGGTYVPPSQRAGSGSHEVSGLAATRGGRGGSRGGRVANLNAVAADFQPGNKRPRGDSEASAGAKRARGSH